jgi:hypothetical protein
MKNHVPTIAVVALALATLGCSGAEGDLRERAQGYGEFLVELRELRESTAHSMLADYLAPSPGRDDRVAEMVEQFSDGSGMFVVTSQSVETVTISDDGSEGTVTFQTAFVVNGRETSALQVTDWVLLEDRWYRTLDEAAKSLRR